MAKFKVGDLVEIDPIGWKERYSYQPPKGPSLNKPIWFEGNTYTVSMVAPKGYVYLDVCEYFSKNKYKNLMMFESTFKLINRRNFSDIPDDELQDTIMALIGTPRNPHG